MIVAPLIITCEFLTDLLVGYPLAPPPAEITVNLDGIAANAVGRQAVRQAAAAANPTPTAAPVTTQAAPVTQAASTISPEA